MNSNVSIALLLIIAQLFRQCTVNMSIGEKCIHEAFNVFFFDGERGAAQDNSVYKIRSSIRDCLTH